MTEEISSLMNRELFEACLERYSWPTSNGLILNPFYSTTLLGSDLDNHPFPIYDNLARIVDNVMINWSNGTSLYRTFGAWEHDNNFYTDVFEWDIFLESNLNLE